MTAIYAAELLHSGEWSPGAVEFGGWHRVPWTEAQAIGVYGDIAVVEAERVLGFKIHGAQHANWVALVRGPSGVVHVIPGCQVQTITYGERAIVCRDFLAVP